MRTAPRPRRRPRADVLLGFTVAAIVAAAVAVAIFGLGTNIDRFLDAVLAECGPYRAPAECDRAKDALKRGPNY